MQQNLREEMAIKQINELKEQVGTLSEERNELETEIVALKKNYLRVRSEWEGEKRKNEELGLELINAVQENKG